MAGNWVGIRRESRPALARLSFHSKILGVLSKQPFPGQGIALHAGGRQADQRHPKICRFRKSDLIQKFGNYEPQTSLLQALRPSAGRGTMLASTAAESCYPESAVISGCR